MFRNIEYNNVPFDGLHIYANQVWDIIKQNKDLNIPN